MLPGLKKTPPMWISHVIEARQQAYLEAMNIPVWVERDQSAYLEAGEVTQVSEVSTPESKADTASAAALPQDASPNPKQPAPDRVEQAASAPVFATDKPVVDQVATESATKQVTPLAEVAPSTAASPGLKLGPGAGGVMLICSKDSDSASKMANDISRALGKMPVWSWPDSDESAISPGDAVDENLFTCVAVFGEALGRLMFGNEMPAALGSAKLVMLPSMTELTSDASARRELWSVLCRSGMIVS